MTRRDTIIIATLVNAGLLACLFVAATRQQEPTSPVALTPESFEPPATAMTLSPPSPQENMIAEDTVSDEVDQALKEFLPEEPKIAEIAEADLEMGIEADLNPELTKEKAPEPPAAIVKTPEPQKTKEEKIVEVTVKSGDMLEKIAKANNTTVKAIKEANNLQSDKLKIGQVLKVPVGYKVAKAAPVKGPTPIVAGDPVYYTVQKGDNPWKIAKKFHVKFEDILKLNNMSEEKAKNLKVGQEIRVK